MELAWGTKTVTNESELLETAPTAGTSPVTTGGRWCRRWSRSSNHAGGCASNRLGTAKRLNTQRIYVIRHRATSEEGGITRRRVPCSLQVQLTKSTFANSF